MSINEYSDFTLQVRDYIISFLNIYGWGILQSSLGFVLFFLCLFERCYDPLYTNKCKSRFRIFGQFGLYIQSMLSIYMIVDGYYTIIYHNIVKIFSIIFMISAIFLKGYLVSLFLEREKNDILPKS